MKKTSVLICLSIASMAASVVGVAATYALFEREQKLSLESGANVPIQTGGARNTFVYVVPTAWSSLLSGGSSVANTYIVACMYKNDDSQFEFQGIRTSNSSKTLISENKVSIDVSTTSTPFLKDAYRFTFDLTYYDRISFHRFGYTTGLGDVIGGLVDGEGPDTFVSKSTDATHIPLDWRNIDKSDTYKRYDATHRQVKPADGNVFQITSTNSGGSYGFLAWGSWYSGVIRDASDEK